MRAVWAPVCAVLLMILALRGASADEALARCPEAGWGYWRIPGDTSCFRLSGRVRVDTGFDQPYLRVSETARFVTRSTLTAQSYSATERGPLTTAVRVSLERGAGLYDVPVSLDYAVIDWGGLTVGRTDSVFERAWPLGGYSFIGGDVNGRGADRGSVDQVSYAWTLASGITLTGSVEDAEPRQTGIGDGLLVRTGTPDLVASLRIDRDGLLFQLAGALHPVRGWRSIGYLEDIDATVYGQATSLLGFAVQGSLRVQVPALGRGGSVTVQGGFAHAANALTGWGYAAAGTYAPWLYDAWMSPTGLKPMRSWSLGGGAQAYVTPAIRSAVFGSVGQVDAWGTEHDVTAWTAGANTLWSPVRNLDVGVEVTYSRLMPARSELTWRLPGDARSGLGGRLRLQLDF